MKTVLALETSCDETAVAVLRGRDNRARHELLASEVASQVAAHEKFGGIVPEIASRNHLIYAPRLLDRAICGAGIEMSVVDAFAATSGPGLASSLMIGASIAKGLAIGFSKPYLAVNHLEGHLLSPFFGSADGGEQIKPNVSLIVSGGHTMSVLVGALADYQLIGRTVDDAAGEAFDKVAKMLGLGYPGGPEIEKRACGGDPNRFDLPRGMPDSENFSFSGLKTAVRYLLPKIGVIANESEGSRTRSSDHRGPKRDQSSSERSFAPKTFGAQDDKLLSDLCASFQQAIIDVLVTKTIVTAQKCHVDLVTVSGGVSCNQELRRQLGEACRRAGFELKTAESWLCTDNAAMIAFAALLRLRAGFQSNVTEEIDPNLALVL
ncbi:MAG TPA: tRNA (adenosine(37)-N6)-threonylcarbamoyltransferase complex transferase subunit TsaD [Candidatus Udaeobacter sp.]|nr:tRNA (adenosine(37)-N6)-threonylcarbamoyltransferase complex transferase subunit TsaD [Candidatus Udaeobacter sp.]